ncbi:hypothetical protein COU96_02555, partial [Candidatus Shapirobacteria bacterium CG10_big_fil_rev_8_21_14_0_10_38_14]
ALDNVQKQCTIKVDMDTITTTTLRNNLADAIDEVTKKNYLLVAKRGKITSALVSIDLFEDLIALSNKKYLASIKKAREEYKKGDIFSHQQVFGEV